MLCSFYVCLTLGVHVVCADCVCSSFPGSGILCAVGDIRVLGKLGRVLLRPAQAARLVQFDGWQERCSGRTSLAQASRREAEEQASYTMQTQAHITHQHNHHTQHPETL